MIANGRGPACLRPPATLGHGRPFALCKIEEHDVFKAGVQNVVVEDLIDRPVTLTLRRLLLGSITILERVVISPSVYEQVLIVLDKDRRVISSRKWADTCLILNLIDYHLVFVKILRF